jgi:two-component system sensor histidine kinase KdpD
MEATESPYELRPKFWHPNFESGFVPFWNTLWLFIGITGLSELLVPYLGYRAVGFIFLMGVLFVGSIGSGAAVLFAAFLSTLAWNFFFIPPRYTFAIAHPEDILLCITYFAIAIMTGFLTRQIRERESFSRSVSRRTDSVFEFLHQIVAWDSRPQQLTDALRTVEPTLQGRCGVLFTDSAGTLLASQPPVGLDHLTKDEVNLAQRVFDTNLESDWPPLLSTDPQLLAIPLRGVNERVGVFLYRPHRPVTLTRDQKIMLHAIARQVASATEASLDHKRLVESDTRGQLEATTSMAQGLSSPRTDEALEVLLDQRGAIGGLAPKLENASLMSMATAAIQNLKPDLAQHKIESNFKADDPLVQVDVSLVQHALINIFRDVARFCPPQAELRLSTAKQGKDLLLIMESPGASIQERGFALKPSGELQLVSPSLSPAEAPAPSAEQSRFDDYRAMRVACRIISLHRGRLLGENRIEGGVRLAIVLPFERG